MAERSFRDHLVIASQNFTVGSDLQDFPDTPISSDLNFLLGSKF